MVDSVADTVSPETGELLPPPPNLHGVQSRRLLGVCRAGDRLVAVLKLDSLLQPEEQTAQMTPKSHAQA